MLYMKQHSRDETIRREAFAEGEERGIAIGEKRGGDNRAAVIAKTMKDDDVPIDI